MSPSENAANETPTPSQYYLGKIKIKSGDEYVQHDRGINPNRLLDVDIDEGTDEEEKEQTAEEKEADQHMDEVRMDLAHSTRLTHCLVHSIRLAHSPSL